MVTMVSDCITFGYKGEKIGKRKIGVQFVPGAKYRKMVTTGQVHMEVSNINWSCIVSFFRSFKHSIQTKEVPRPPSFIFHHTSQKIESTDSRLIKFAHFPEVDSKNRSDVVLNLFEFELRETAKFNKCDLD